MKYKHFDDTRLNHNINFTMLYFAACRSLCKLEVAILRTNGSKHPADTHGCSAGFKTNLCKCSHSTSLTSTKI